MVRCQVVHVAECPAILPPNKLVEIPHPRFSLHIVGQVKCYDGNSSGEARSKPVVMLHLSYPATPHACA